MENSEINTHYTNLVKVQKRLHSIKNTRKLIFKSSNDDKIEQNLIKHFTTTKLHYTNLNLREQITNPQTISIKESEIFDISNILEFKKLLQENNSEILILNYFPSYFSFFIF